jgi:predicted transposase YdaD
MAERTLMSFDWAIKKVLRHKENFDVLEGFLSELLGFDVWIQKILESEGNQQSENDKWFYVLKKSEIKDSFKAKGMKRAKTILDVERMSFEERRAYQRHIENRRIENSVIETAVDKSIRLRNIEIAKESLKEGLSITDVAKISKLDVDEVSLLAEGKELDTDTDY